jgi:hypothetical protein
MAKQGTTSKPSPQVAAETYLGGMVTKRQLKRWGSVLVAAVVVVILTIVGVRALTADLLITRFDRNAMRLLGLKPVQDYLKLSEEQLTKLRTLDGDLTKAVSYPAAEGLTEREKEQKKFKLQQKSLAKILDAGQLKRLKQIDMQTRGRRAWTDEDVAKVLKLTSQQKKQITELDKQQQKEQRELFPRAGADGKRDEKQMRAAREKMTELRKSYEQQIVGVLTDKQQSAWQDMIGDPVAVEVLWAAARSAGQSGQGGQGGQGGPGGRR